MRRVAAARRLSQGNSDRSLAEVLRYKRTVVRARLGRELAAARALEQLTRQKTAHCTAWALAVQVAAARSHSRAAEALAEAVEAQAAPVWGLVVGLDPLITIKP